MQQGEKGSQSAGGTHPQGSLAWHASLLNLTPPP